LFSIFAIGIKHTQTAQKGEGNETEKGQKYTLVVHYDALGHARPQLERKTLPKTTGARTQATLTPTVMYAYYGVLTTRTSNVECCAYLQESPDVSFARPPTRTHAWSQPRSTGLIPSSLESQGNPSPIEYTSEHRYQSCACLSIIYIYMYMN